MILKLDIERVRTVDEVRDFMAGSEPVDFHLTERRGAYDFVTRTLRRLNYAGLSKADKGVVRRFVAKVTGLSRASRARASCPEARALPVASPLAESCTSRSPAGVFPDR